MSISKTSSGAGQLQSRDSSHSCHGAIALETEAATGQGHGGSTQNHSRTSQYRGVTRHRRSGR